MTNKPRVFVALSVRDEISTSPSLRRELKHSTYHWSVYIELKNSIGTPGRSYDVVFEDHYSNLPDSGGWKYCSEPNGSDFRLLGMVSLTTSRTHDES